MFPAITLLIGAVPQTDYFGSNAMKSMKTVFPILLIVVFLGATQAKVKVWEEDLVLPSYRLNPPDPNPMFYRNES